MKITDLDLTALYDLADECIEMYHQEINAIQAIGYNKGLMKSTATWVQGDKENEIKMQFILPDYYVFVEEGRLPSHRADNPQKVYQNILNWVRAKGITAQPKNGKKPATQEQLAWAIYKKIHKQGYYGLDSHGKHPLKTTLQRMESANMKQRAADIIARTINKELHAELMDWTKLSKR